MLYLVTFLLLAITLDAAGPRLQPVSITAPIPVSSTVISAVETSTGNLFLLAVNLTGKIEFSLTIVNKQGKLLRRIMANDPDHGGFVSPFKLTSNTRTDQVWLADAGQQELFVYAPNGARIAREPIRDPALAAHDIAFDPRNGHLILAGCVAKNIAEEGGCTFRIVEFSTSPRQSIKSYFSNRGADFAHTRPHHALSMSTIAVAPDGQLAFADTPDRTIHFFNPASKLTTTLSLDKHLTPFPVTYPPGGILAFTRTSTAVGTLESVGSRFVLGLRRFDGQRPPLAVITQQHAIEWLAAPPGMLVGSGPNGTLLFSNTEPAGVRITRAKLQ